MLPGVAAGRRGLFGAAHPLVADLTGWADAWRDDALDATAPKPVGFYGPVTWSANQFGGEGLWWTTADDQADTAVWGTGESSHQLELLRMAYHASTATDRWRYLLPAVRLFRAAQTWELAGKPANPPALPAASNVLWAAKSFYNSPRFHSMVVAHLHDLSNDPVLTTADDPAVSGTSPYVDAGLISRLTTWSEIETVGGLNQGLRYALLPVQPCGGPQQLKPQVNLETGYDKALLYLRAVYPFVTKHVLHTDRLMLSRATANLLASHVGASLLEGQPFRPRVQWVVPAGAWDELSILCNQLDYGGAVYGAFVHNSGAAPIAAELALDEGLLPGTYLIESGTASPGCDDFPSGSSLVSFTVSKRGGGLRVPVTLQPGLQRVRATRIGAPDSPASKYDLALDPPVFRMTPAPAGAPGVLPRAVIRVRVVNAGPAASPWATLQLFASIADPPLAPVTAIAGFDSLIHTASIPALPGATGYTLAEHTVQVTLPLAALGPILAGEYELRLRAEIAVDAREWDPLNNSLSRSVTLHDLTFLWPH
ncbi:MAG TPA: hypothetical protein VFD43_08220 [Planctomycetota bacterium]|nr:hypothetical protein [Planctomycetota bacterium]